MFVYGLLRLVNCRLLINGRRHLQVLMMMPHWHRNYIKRRQGRRKSPKFKNRIQILATMMFLSPRNSGPRILRKLKSLLRQSRIRNRRQLNMNRTQTMTLPSLSRNPNPNPNLNPSNAPKHNQIPTMTFHLLLDPKSPKQIRKA
jgi:hypothetical protein